MSNLEQIVDSLSALTVMEAAKLSKMLEEKWGVSAAAPAAAAPAAAAPTAEKTEFEVVVTAVDAAKKINVIKEVRAITNLGLGEAKAFVESVPKTIKEGASKEEAAKLKEVLEAAGATVQIK